MLAQDAGRDEVQHGFPALDDDRVAGIIAAGVAHDDVRRFGEYVDDLAFAFVAPLGTDQNCVGHKFLQAAPKIANKNPRIFVRGKAAGSLLEESR